MKVLGLGGSLHDFSACLVDNSEIKVAVEEERLVRVKYAYKLGERVSRCKAAKYCLDSEGISIDDVVLIVANDYLTPGYYLKYRKKVKLISHHLSHAASVFYPSKFEKSAILVLDGGGSQINSKNQIFGETITYYLGEGSQISTLKDIKGEVVGEDYEQVYTNSLGFFYGIVTNSIGFNSQGYIEPGKTMGLAPYGTDKYVKEFYKFYNCDINGNFNQSLEQQREMEQYINHVLENMKTLKRLEQAKADFAFAVQYHTEDIVIKLCNYLYEKTQIKNLCISGGVALNSVVNYKVLENTPFENVFVMPATGDTGTGIGAALYGYYALGGKHRNPSKTDFSPYLGKEYTEIEIKQSLEQYKESIIVSEPKNLHKTVAKLISDKNIIGWFQGKSEVGPRALGNRSILADPRYNDMKDLINTRIKHREPFRPFAPAVLEEEQDKYFSMKESSYYMLFVPKIHNSKQKDVPSITHIDGTGRMQTVSKDMNLNFHKLISEFKNLTGIPILLNTSFNDNGEPIVESPNDAIKCFLNIDLDYLVIGKYLIQKNKN